ncbi:LON peptidase substrate-binding domain-containing protein [Planctomyces sp. SH-PL62]|uniref:LON peptidase substrate-binding domain-containing protein n=1 Tax=Planctomyces sp. SH-PL62 TaxID=1636152 RepID=UPI00078D971F|nr:LON peptidase substrate-binding domain-containing protein [Planctomyces sp. SH-PL62]AMV37416.1 Lon protease [Planctomyces sp. SH-PL62]
MGDELDLKDFSGRARLFPLPGVVMFPHVVAPLHIFEPRYRRMVEDALDGDRLIAMVQVAADPATAWKEPPPVAQVGCLGRIVHHERLADGRFNILLLGLKRARLIRETPDPELLYRTAEVVLIEDEPSSRAEAEGRAYLVDRFRDVLGAAGDFDPEFFKLLANAESLGGLTDVMAHALPFSAESKQRLLAEPSVDVRVRMLYRWIGELVLVPPEKRPFPPPFSDN